MLILEQLQTYQELLPQHKTTVSTASTPITNELFLLTDGDIEIPETAVIC